MADVRGELSGVARVASVARVARRTVHRARAAVPAYLEETYWWAYMRPASIRIFDHNLIVTAILWGNYGRLKAAALREFEAGQKILQTACVYGDLSPRVAAKVGPAGSLDVVDVVDIQIENCRRKLRPYPWSRVRRANAATPGGGPYDAACCFFLLHELPEAYKHRVVDALLSAVKPGGKVVFVDYHRPRRFHPLKHIMAFVNGLLEPFATRMWECEIRDFASHSEAFIWDKTVYFGGLYQKVVARRRR